MTKSVLIFFTLGIALTNCVHEDDNSTINELDNFYTVDIHSIPGTGQSSFIIVSLTTLGDEIVTSASEVKPDTPYKLNITSERKSYFRIGNSFGFDIIESPDVSAGPQNFSQFIIKTSKNADEISSGLYAKVTPVHYIDSKLKRDQSRALLLPGKN
jgi:hypothetical protein